MRKFMLFIVLIYFFSFVYADICLAGSSTCNSEEKEESGCIPAEIMAEMYARSKNSGTGSASNISSSILRVAPFQAIIQPTNPIPFTVYSLTHYKGDNGKIHDLVSSIKNQASLGECTRFATTGAIEIKLAKQYSDIFQITKDKVTEKGGDPATVEANLSEAYAREIAGCRNDTVLVAEKLVSRGIVQEEHYPYNQVYFGNEEYHSKRDIQRYGTFQYEKCDENKDHYNTDLWDKRISNSLLLFSPKSMETLTGEHEDKIEKVKASIRSGEPVIMSYRASCSIRTTPYIDMNMGKFKKGVFLENRDNTGMSEDGHAVIIVGYIKSNTNIIPDYFIIKNSHDSENILEFFPIDSKFKDYCNPITYNTFGDIEVFRGREILSAESIAATDTDNDKIPDIFDNSVYSKDYTSIDFPDLSNVSYNPTQEDADKDETPMEKDFCPYIEDNVSAANNNSSNTSINLKADMDMDGIGDYCDEDIDGDGISNISEGLSRAYLYQLTSLTENEYAALNPFIDGRSGKVVNKYFVSKAFREGEEIKLKENYISSIDFYLMPFNDSEENPPVFQFVKDKNYYHNWYLNTNAPGKWIRKFSYKDEKDKLHDSYGLRWNIPGLFEMSRITYQQYKRDNYGENYPESFYNCMLHCEKLYKLHGGSSNKKNIIDQNDCQNACENAYQCDVDIDWDCDGIRDEYDVCPSIKDLSQQDSDGDGVPNTCDNCPKIPNPMELNNSEIVAAPCENGAGGAFCMGLSSYKDADGNWWWQPDHNLNRSGDACDIYPAVWAEFSGTPAGTSVKNGITYQDKNLKVVSMRRNETLSVAIDMLKSEPTPTSTETATTRYCWITKEELDAGVWGRDGFCTTEAGHTKGACDINFGYSHGTDPKPTDSEWNPTWKFIKKKDNPEESDEFTKIETGSSETVDWDWRYDFKQDRPWDVGTSLDTAPECTNFSLGVCQDANVPKFYYTMSTGVHSGNIKEDYIINGNEINPKFFKLQGQDKKYARSSRLMLDPVVISYHTEPFIIFSPIDDYCTGRCDFILEEYQEMMINELINGPRPYEMPGMDHYFKNDYGSDLINTGVSFREWSSNAAGMPSVSEKNRPMYLTTMSKNAAGTNVGLVAEINSTATQLRDMKASSGVTFEIAEMDPNSNGDWRTKGVLQNVPAGFAPTASVHHNGNLYVVSNGEKGTQVYEIKSTGQTVIPEDGYNICFHPVKIVNPIQIGTLPNNLSGITLHSVGNSLMALGKGGNGMEVYKFSKKGFENITGANSPQIRDIYNVEVKDGVLYLAGGAELSKDSVDLKTDFWSFSETDGWQLVRDDLNLFPLTLRIDFDGENVILTNRAIRHNATTDRAIFNADGTGNITLETIKVEGAPVQKYEESFCISETDNSIFPGITNFYGECRRVENYDFDEITFPDYKLSVAGYRNSLYLGGLSGIRRVEIGENGEITKREMIYSGEANNLAVFGNTLYAANYSEIDIFEIADIGKIERKSSIKTNDCKNIRIAGNKFFAAENKRVRVFGLSNPLSPEPIKTISLGNNAEDLEIAENRLFVYENLNGLLTRKGKVSVFDISDLENTQKVSDFSQYCNDPEMQKRFDNAQRPGNSVYLGCKNGTFKVTESGLQSINGSKNYLREGYVFDGILYQVFSGTLHKSSLKAEEIEEDGWF